MNSNTSRVGVIYIDPLEIPDDKNDADYILITHDHYDHFSPEDIRKVAKSGSVLVVPEKMAAKAQEVSGSVGRIETVKPAVYREISDLEFETVPAYNTLKPFHPKSAEWVGYVLRIDGKRIYIAGDTDATRYAYGRNILRCSRCCKVIRNIKIQGLYRDQGAQ